MGFVSNAVVGVWIGRPDDNPINQQTGLTAAAPVWSDVMSQTVASNTRSRPTAFPQPNTVNTVPICPDTGVQQGGVCASPIRNEYFAINRQPPPACWLPMPVLSRKIALPSPMWTLTIRQPLPG
jgi:membrane carboxypeptidase/penicillin-binding protein PbpC